MFFVVVIGMILSSVFGKKHRQEESILENMIGRTVELPGTLEFEVSGDTIAFNPCSTDYSIICFIDSEGCTPCRMKLLEWDKVICELNSGADTDVGFAMIIADKDIEKIKYLVEKDLFKHPVAIDANNVFNKVNELPKTESCRTFMVDDSGEIIAVGNPVMNPNILDYYKKIIGNHNIRNTNPVSCEKTVERFGVIKVGEKAEINFVLTNNGVSVRRIRKIVTSCDCTETVIPDTVINPGDTAAIRVSYVPDSVKGFVSNSINVFFKESDNPLKLKIQGYVK